MRETSKALMRRLNDSRFATRYFVGRGLDVGAGADPIGELAAHFPLMRTCRAWDMQDGDAQLLDEVPDESFDFVHSSHCLEHVVDPAEALYNWLRVLRPGGHLIVLVPDEDLYEQGVFPSTFNDTHRWTLTIQKARSWSRASLNLFSLLGEVADMAQVLKIELLDASYSYGAPRADQTLSPATESAIEFVLRRWTPDESRRGGRLPPA